MLVDCHKKYKVKDYQYPLSVLIKVCLMSLTLIHPGHCINLLGAYYQVKPLPAVSGLRWGTFVGSPALDEPWMAWTQSFGSVVADVVALPTGDVFGLAPCSTLLVMYRKERG